MRIGCCNSWPRARRTLRPDDTIARWRGGQFAVILPATGTVAAAAVIRDQAVTAEPMTFTAGLLTIDRLAPLGAVMTAVDELLYLARSSGPACLAVAAAPPADAELHITHMQPAVHQLFWPAEVQRLETTPSADTTAEALRLKQSLAAAGLLEHRHP